MKPHEQPFIDGSARFMGERTHQVAVNHRVVAIATQHPIQHFSPAFRALTDRGVVNPLVLYFDDLRSGQHDPGFARHVTWDVELLSGYSFYVAEGRNAPARLLSGIRWLHQVQPAAVLTFGWATGAARAGILYALATRTPLLLYGDNSWQHRPSTLRTHIRDRIIRIVLRRAAGAVATGTFNREDWVRLGIHPGRTFPGTYPIDVERFTNERRPKRSGTRFFHIGFVGKLIGRKGADELLRAIAALPDQLVWRCSIVGDGPMMPTLRALAAELGVAARVDFVGFTNQASIPRRLAEMDVLVVPSTIDMRVLIVSEAMAVGTPVIVSTGTAVWGEGDQVDHGVSGLVYRSGQPAQLTERILELASSDELRDRLARRAKQEVVDRAHPDYFARTIEHAVTQVARLRT